MTKARLSDWDVPETPKRPTLSRGVIATLVRYGAALSAIAGGMLGIFAVVGNLSGHLPHVVERLEIAGLPAIFVMLAWLGLHGLAIFGGLALLRLIGIGRAITIIVLTILTLTLIAGLSDVTSLDAAVPALLFAAYLLSRLAGILNPRVDLDVEVDEPTPARIEPGLHAATPRQPIGTTAAAPRPVPSAPNPRPSDRRPITVRRTTAALIVALVAFDSVVITLIASSLIWPSAGPVTTALGVSEPAETTPIQHEPPRAATLLPPIAQPLLEPAAYADPFDYCDAIGSIDAVDARYDGPNPPPALSQRLGEAANSADVEIVWRCSGGKVQACAQRYWPVCNKTPEMDDMLTFCTAIGRTGTLAAPGGPWACEDNRPVLPEDARWPVDAHGFLPQAWTQVEAASIP